MLKTLLVAWREFGSTVFTKGFLLGVLMTPVILVVVAGGIALMKNLPRPRVVGTIGVIDRTGASVGAGVERRFSPEAIEAERKARSEKVTALAKEQGDKLGLPPDQAAAASGMANQALDESSARADLSVELLPTDTDEAAQKTALGLSEIHAKDRGPADAPPRVALVVIPDTAVRPDAAGDYAGFDLFTAPKLDFEVQGRIREKVREAIIDARIRTDERAVAGGLSPEAVRALVEEPAAKAVTITRDGEKKNTGAAQMMIPMAFMLLLLMSVMTGGQYLLTTTVEEKSNRVMEVLLSAVSPLQLMVGKIVGQMCVGLLILIVYSGIGVAGLIAFSLQHILDPMLLVYLFIFYFIAFFVIASMMAAAGSAVSEMREAQTLMTPIMVIVMLPWLLWLPISRAPNSLFATILSFVPGINPFVMMIRLTGSEPPPAWQIPLSILVGLLTVVFCAWAAAKVFRIGVLMYGKPPNFRTLVRWVRMA